MGTNIIAGVPILPAFIARQRQRFIGRFEKAGVGRGWRQAINLFLLDIFSLDIRSARTSAALSALPLAPFS